MDARAVARRRLASTRLRGPAFGSATDAVAGHLAMQAQDLAPAKWSIGQRSRGLVEGDVDRALTEGEIVRTHVLRPTWHFVAREDIRWLLALSGPRVRRSVARRYRDLGLDARSLARAERLVVAALGGGNRLTRNELADVLDRGRFDREGQRMPFLLMHLELDAVIVSGGPAGKQHTYALLDERVPAARPLEREEALAELTRRYLRSHGPATVKDLSWWSGLTMGDLRGALGDLGDEARHDEVDGLTVWSIPGPPSRAAARAHLLQTYDELVVGYTESRFLGDPNAARARAAWGDRSFPSGVVLDGDLVAGHWKRTTARDGLRIEVVTYARPGEAFREALAAAAERHGAFFGREVTLEVRPVA